MDRDSTHVRFWVYVQPGSSGRCGSQNVRTVGVLVERIGPRVQRGPQYLKVEQYVEGAEGDAANRLLSFIDDVTKPS